MKSLVLSRWRPHKPDGGAALRNAQNIAALSALGDVDVISIGRAEVEEPVPGIRDWRHFEIRRPPRQMPGRWLFQSGHHPLLAPFADQRVNVAIEQKLSAEAYDLAVVEEISLASYLSQLRRSGVRTVFDAHNVESDLRAALSVNAQRSIKTRLKANLLGRRLRRVEVNAVRTADQVWACSEGDRAVLQSLAPEKDHVRTIPNTVNFQFFEKIRHRQRSAIKPGDPIRLVYTGTYSYEPNEAAALMLIQSIVPAIRQRGGTVRLLLVGRDPTPAMQTAAAGDADIVVTGGVETILPFLAEPCIVPVPLVSGSGTRLKICEAFAANAAVISTRKGAEGIDAIDGETILIAETADDFADAALTLWRDHGRRIQQADAAFELGQRSYSWDASQATIREALNGLASV